MARQRVPIFLETLVEFSKIKWDVYQEEMNFNLVWFLPTVTFPALRKSQCVAYSFVSATPQTRSLLSLGLNLDENA